MKNVIALASGVGDGLGFNNNARAALITRGLVEIARLGEAKGAQETTFYDSDIMKQLYPKDCEQM